MTCRDFDTRHSDTLATPPGCRTMGALLKIVVLFVALLVGLFFAGVLTPEPDAPAPRDGWWGRGPRAPDTDTAVKPFKVRADGWVGPRQQEHHAGDFTQMTRRQNFDVLPGMKGLDHSFYALCWASCKI